MRQSKVGGHQIMSNGQRVWINSPTTGAAVARVSAFGDKMMIDIHREPTDQAQRGECLDCFVGPCSLDTWERFVASVKTHYGITVPLRHCPTVVKEKL